MSLLTLDKIEQLRIQLEQCTNLKTASAFRIAISRLESQLRFPKQEPPHLKSGKAILQSLIDKSAVQIYQPTPEARHIEPRQTDLADQSAIKEAGLSFESRASVHQSSGVTFVDPNETALLQFLIDQGRVKVY